MPVNNIGPMTPPMTPPSIVRAGWNTAPVEVPVRDVFDAGFLREACGVERIEHLFAKAGLVPAEAVDRGFLRAVGVGTLDQIAEEFAGYDSWAEFEAAAQAWKVHTGRI